MPSARPPFSFTLPLLPLSFSRRLSRQPGQDNPKTDRFSLPPLQAFVVLSLVPPNVTPPSWPFAAAASSAASARIQRERKEGQPGDKSKRHWAPYRLQTTHTHAQERGSQNHETPLDIPLDPAHRPTKHHPQTTESVKQHVRTFWYLSYTSPESPKKTRSTEPHCARLSEWPYITTWSHRVGVGGGGVRNETTLIRWRNEGVTKFGLNRLG